MSEERVKAVGGGNPVPSCSPFAKRRVASAWSITPPTGGGAGSAAGPQISIVAPLRNEGGNVIALAQRIADAMRQDSRTIEIILVDDASTDETWDKILEARRADNRVRGLRHLQRGGQSAALWTGFEASRGSVIATLDGDLQNDPADVPKLIAELATCDLACGVRTRRQDNALRRVSSAVARWARRSVLGVDFRDTGCNLRAFKRPVLQTLLPFDGLHRFMPVLAHHAGAVVKEVPVTHHPRTAGRSKYGLWNRLGRGIRDLFMVGSYQKRQLAVIPVVEQMDD